VSIIQTTEYTVIFKIQTKEAILRRGNIILCKNLQEQRGPAKVLEKVLVCKSGESSNSRYNAFN